MHKYDSEYEYAICVTCVALCERDPWLNSHGPPWAEAEPHWGFSGDPLAFPHI